MKPQREGGGNNIYGKDIPQALERMSMQERSAHILMEIIRAPSIDNLLLRDGKQIASSVIGEFSIYGLLLKYDPLSGCLVVVLVLTSSSFTCSKNGKDILNCAGGHLLRSKALGVNEGGIAAGFSVIDSPMLY